MHVGESPDWVETWEDVAVYGVCLWRDRDLLTWFRLQGCDVVAALAWAATRANGAPYSVALLVSDPTEREPDQDGRIWLHGGNVLAGQAPAPPTS